MQLYFLEGSGQQKAKGGRDMKKGASSIEVKRLNRNRVFRYLNSRERTSMPDIAEALGMSGPTDRKSVV